MTPRVLFLYGSGQLASVPMLINLIDALQAAEIEVSVLSPAVTGPLPAVLRRTRRLTVPASSSSAPMRIATSALGDRLTANLAEAYALHGALRDVRPHVVVVVDSAACVAAALAIPASLPIVTCSLELLVRTELTGRYWPVVHAFEAGVTARARLVLIQDRDRGAILAREHRVPDERFAYVPNAPRGDAARQRTPLWRERFQLPADARVALYAGSWAPWACLDEVVASVARWPANWHLVVHARYQPDSTRSLEALAANAGVSARVHLSTVPVSADDTRALFDGADAGIALYRPSFQYTTDGENLRVLGASAGKVAALAQAGVPIITNQDTSLGELIPRFDAGLAVSAAPQIGAALADVERDADRFSRGALALFTAHFDPERGLADAVRRIRLLVDDGGRGG